MNFSIHSDTDKYSLADFSHIEEITRSLSDFCQLSKTDCCLNINFTDDAGIEPVNIQFLQHEGPTDVISFDYMDDFDPECTDPDDPFVIGDLLISLETAKRQAEIYNTSFNDEALLYLAHGILHLCGYDDHQEADIKEMRAAEQRCMNHLKEKFDDPRILA